MKFNVTTIACCILISLLTFPEDVSPAVASTLLAAKLALTPPAAFAGLITGIIGTVLGAISVKLHLENLAGMEEEEQNYGKRSIGTVQERIDEAESEVDAFLDQVYRNDFSRCLEKLICNIARSRSTSEAYSSQVENSLLKMASSSNHLGFVSKRMETSMKAGFGQSDCSILFDSCTLEDTLMLNYIEAILQQVSSDSLRGQE